MKINLMLKPLWQAASRVCYMSSYLHEEEEEEREREREREREEVFVDDGEGAEMITSYNISRVAVVV